MTESSSDDLVILPKPVKNNKTESKSKNFNKNNTQNTIDQNPTNNENAVNETNNSLTENLIQNNKVNNNGLNNKTPVNKKNNKKANKKKIEDEPSSSSDVIIPLKNPKDIKFQKYNVVSQVPNDSLISNNIILTSNNNVVPEPFKKTKTTNSYNKKSKTATTTKVDTILTSNNITQLDATKNILPDINAKYIIKFKSGDFEKIFYKNDNDLVESIYQELFGNDETKKLYCEDSKLSKFFTIEEAGFFPGVNYITTDSDEYFEKIKNINLTLKVGENIENDIKITLFKLEKVEKLFLFLQNYDKNDFYLINNGSILKNDDLLKDCCDEEDCIDVVRKDMVDFFK